jgi:hypothetical protein
MKEQKKEEFDYRNFEQEAMKSCLGPSSLMKKDQKIKVDDKSYDVLGELA